MTSGPKLARNSAVNVLGQLLPLVVALVAIPPLIRGFGTDRFAVLALVWATIGYFGLFELGLGRALTQAVARRLGTSRQSELTRLARTGVALLFLLGCVAGVVVLVAAPVLVTRVLEIPAGLRDETLDAFRLLAAALPFVLATSGLRGLLEAHQDFGAATALRVPTALFSYAAPLVTLPFSPSLVPAVAAIAAGRVLVSAAHLVVCVARYGYLRTRSATAPGAIRDLLRFGGWLTVSSVVSPMMVYLDRFVIGATFGIAAVTAYVTPYEGLARLLIVPGALTGALMPAIASTLVTADRAAAMYEQTLRVIVVLMFPVTLACVALAPEILLAWAGPVLPPESVRVMQWLAAGILFSALAHAPATALQGRGAPDVVAKLHLLELPLYVALLAVCMQAFALPGVAIAWTARAAVDAIALSWLAHRRLGVAAFPSLGRARAWTFAVMIALMAVAATLPSTAVRVVFTALVCGVFAMTAWRALQYSRNRNVVLYLSNDSLVEKP